MAGHCARWRILFTRISARQRAVLLIELEGLTEAVAAQTAAVDEICRAHHAREVRIARDQRERELLWKGRRMPSARWDAWRPALRDRRSDSTFQNSASAAAHQRIGEQYNFEIGNIFHAGDGNLHPIVLYDPRNAEQYQRAIAACTEIIRYCVEIGGALTGEHGVGMEKSELMPLLFSDADFDLMRRYTTRSIPIPR